VKFFILLNLWVWLHFVKFFPLAAYLGEFISWKYHVINFTFEVTVSRFVNFHLSCPCFTGSQCFALVNFSDIQQCLSLTLSLFLQHSFSHNHTFNPLSLHWNNSLIIKGKYLPSNWEQTLLPSNSWVRRVQRELCTSRACRHRFQNLESFHPGKLSRLLWWRSTFEISTPRHWHLQHVITSTSSSDAVYSNHFSSQITMKPFSERLRSDMVFTQQGISVEHSSFKNQQD